MAKAIKAEQLMFDDDLNIEAVPMEEVEQLQSSKVEYKDLDKVDLVRLCTEKDNAIASYETESEIRDKKNEETIKNLNEYYAKRIEELKSLNKYYERKFKLLETIINIEKEEQ